MKVIVGLGNPGDEYRLTRHNVGFMTVDEIAKKHHVDFKLDAKLKAVIAIIPGVNKTILVKPVTYMNLSGEAVSAVLRYYKVEIDDLLVIYDDLDLDVGKLRLRQSGSAGGHNGIKSLIAHLKTQDFKRVRIGISRNKMMNVADYVLSKFSEDDMALINQAKAKVVDLSFEFIKDVSFHKLMSQYNQ